MKAALLPSRTLWRAAKRRPAASSVAPVAYGYQRSLRLCMACFSRLESTIWKQGRL